VLTQPSGPSADHIPSANFLPHITYFQLIVNILYNCLERSLSPQGCQLIYKNNIWKNIADCNISVIWPSAVRSFSQWMGIILGHNFYLKWAMEPKKVNFLFFTISFPWNNVSCLCVTTISTTICADYYLLSVYSKGNFLEQHFFISFKYFYKYYSFVYILLGKLYWRQRSYVIPKEIFFSITFFNYK